MGLLGLRGKQVANLTIPLQRIESEARQVDPGRVLLTILLTVPYVLGWIARKTWVIAALLWTAVGVGWKDAAGPETTKKEGTDERV